MHELPSDFQPVTSHELFSFEAPNAPLHASHQNTIAAPFRHHAHNNITEVVESTGMLLFKECRSFEKLSSTELCGLPNDDSAASTNQDNSSIITDLNTQISLSESLHTTTPHSRSKTSSETHRGLSPYDLIFDAGARSDANNFRGPPLTSTCPKRKSDSRTRALL